MVDPEAQQFIDQLFGKREAPAEPDPGPSIEDASDEELVAQQEAIEAERERRTAEDQAAEFREALARSRTKPSHVALIEGLHGGEPDE